MAIHHNSNHYANYREKKRLLREAYCKIIFLFALVTSPNAVTPAPPIKILAISRLRSFLHLLIIAISSLEKSYFLDRLTNNHKYKSIQELWNVDARKFLNTFDSRVDTYKTICYVHKNIIHEEEKKIVIFSWKTNNNGNKQIYKQGDSE